MKRFNKKNGIWTVAILSCVLMLAGCGTQEQDDDKPEKQTQTEAENVGVPGGEETQNPEQNGEETQKPEQNAGEESAGENGTGDETKEPDISGEVLGDTGEVLTSYPAKTPVAVDLDGDGEVEQVQFWFEGDNNYPTIQIDEIVFGEENWQQVDYYLSDPWKEEWFLIDTDTTDGYKEIALFDAGPSDDPCTILMRYEAGNLREIGSFTAHPYNATITGDGIVYAALRMDILETNFVEGKWKLEGKDSFTEAVLQLQDRPVYEILSYPGRWDGEYCPVTAKSLQMFIGQDLTAEMVVLDPGEMVIPYRYYPDGENGWVELAYGKDFQYRGFVYINVFNQIYQTNESGEVLYMNSYEMLEGLLFAD